VNTIDLDRQREARDYAVRRRVLSLIDLAVATILLVGIILTGLAISLRQATANLPGGRLTQVAAVFVALIVGFQILSLPFEMYGHGLSRRFGISTQDVRGWLGDWLKGLGIGIVLGGVMVEALYALLAALPTLWWLVAAGLYLLLVVGLANLAPIVILPLFYKLTPLDPSPLTDRLAEMAERAGARVRGVYRMNLSSKTTAANAALMGLGNTRRVVLGDTLLDRYEPDEIAVVFAHELGHHVHRDVPRLVATQALLTLAGLYCCTLVLNWGIVRLGYTGISDVATMPLIVLVLGAFGVITGPIVSWSSRRMEVAADEYALRTTGYVSAFISGMTRLANQNLAEYDPPAWVEFLFYDHPSVGRRVRFASDFARSQRS
jgi:STE24 endopeptidase